MFGFWINKSAMVINSTVGLSLLSATGFTSAAVVLIRRKNDINLSAGVFIPLLLATCLYDFIVVSNFLEHSGLSAYFDPLEDIAEIVFTLIFLFFVNNWRKDRSEARFRELFKLTPMSLAEVTRHGRIIEVNENFAKELKEFHGITIDDMPTINKWWEHAYPDPENRDRIMSAWQKAVDRTYKTGAPIDPEEREMTCRDGKIRTAIVSANIIGKNLLFSMVDISDRKQAEAEREKLQKQLLQAQKLEAIGILAGGVAHDFNNILGAIMGYAELTLDQMNPGNPFYGNVVKILDAARRSARLTRQLLIFARKQATTPMVIDVNASVATMLKILRRLIGENIELVWLPAGNHCTIKMDPSQLDQILTNLCVNAKEAIADIGQVTIKTATVFLDDKACKHYIDSIPGNYVRLSVIDNGSGMDKETIQHVFEPFFTTKGVGHGTGLGLATIYGIVKQNYGFINLQSELGTGTTFDIYIPLHADESVSEQVQASDAIPRGQGETILLVEDDPMLIEMSRIMLDRLGYKVLTATTPGEAIQLARKISNEIDLFITDVVMPEMNGRELIDRLLLIHPGVKYLFMSGYTSDVIIHRGVSEEEGYFIQKPFSQKDIAVKVREILDANGK